LMLFKTATKTIDIVLTQKSLLNVIEMHSTELEKAKKRGVRIYIAAKLDKNGRNQLKKYSKSLKIRDVDFHTRFCIVDNQEMLFMLVDDVEVHKNYDSAVWMNSPYFASALSNMLGSY